METREPCSPAPSAHPSAPWRESRAGSSSHPRPKMCGPQKQFSKDLPIVKGLSCDLNTIIPKSKKAEATRFPPCMQRINTVWLTPTCDILQPQEEGNPYPHYIQHYRPWECHAPGKTVVTKRQTCSILPTPSTGEPSTGTEVEWGPRAGTGTEHQLRKIRTLHGCIVVMPLSCVLKNG